MSRAPGTESTRVAGRHRPGSHRSAVREGYPQCRSSALPSMPAVPAGAACAVADAEESRLRRLTKTIRRPSFVRNVARTAGFNIGTTVAAGLGGIIIARALGPTGRGEYAAVTAWFGVAVMVGGMGQSSALCFFVARDPTRASQYLATSRAMMLATGALVLAASLLLAPHLAHGNTAVATAYRIAFCVVIIALVGASYTYSLQARNISRWNMSRTVQPLASAIAIMALWRLRMLTLDTALLVLGSTMLMQLAWAYWSCRGAGLVPGRARADLVRPLAVYGAAQIAAFTPAALNQQLDQLVLSQAVPPADLGRYAIAVSLTLLPLPVVSAIGYVAFPRLASKCGVTAETRRLQRVAVLGSAGLSIAILAPLAVAAPWVVPAVFGSAYRAAVPLIWVLTPGALFMICGQVVVDLLLGRGHPTVVAWAQSLAAVSTIALLFSLLPFIGVYAAAIASTVSYGVAFAVMLRRLLHLPAHARGSGPRASGSRGEPHLRGAKKA